MHGRQGRGAQAQAHYEAALAILRQVADRRAEGYILGNLGELLLGQGRIAEARTALQTGEALLRDVGDPMELAKLLCVRGQAELIDHDIGLARAALAEAETLAEALDASPDAPLGRRLLELRTALA